ncbi:hypothetical protein PHYSODRAFT_313101 [Phytophthora sojae]|uniref:Uncharacterized protein n=1 Tax=Phytophthora sojae (strain P6497) TaxID=1094619 RepID=G4Z879_PHYSP|nr:hypothetical protein PHYSODRAFT_313101 [Phytophthora sojae]EGZ20431.1 hypothetical protein PHYSODRAFT_313101 [Phytophthora sojae]|eukprot:XP_009523148.1 hypothetical protein PHYSODRAFT_313101 [Phytophthora sojae]
MDRALRLQQQLFMSEFVQQVVSNQDSPSHFVPRVKPGSDNNQRSRSRSKPYWATSAVSPGIEKLLQRQRRAPSASKSRPTSASTKPVHQPRSSRAPVATSTKPLLQPRSSRVTQRKPPPSPPPRRQLDNDQHLAWAARISELYRPTVEQ